MVFPTIQFGIFFPIVLALNWALMPRQRVWKPFIVVVSYVFYAAANPVFCVLLGGVTLWNQLGAVLIDRTDDEGRRRWILAAAVVGDLVVLGFFKYYSFFVQDVSNTLDAIGLGSPLPLMTVLLPIGVSFFTFQAISYVVDVKRRLVKPASLMDTAIYLSFFPHLVAGPIVRAREFLPQLQSPRNPERVAVGAGVGLVALGLIKKVAIADYLGRAVVDPVFNVPQLYAAPDVLIAAYAFTAQIYCDFSGYTDIAIGTALLMGFVFPQNFNSPYRATGFRDFWRRWHMTLSRFLRDFVYIPLGGNRKGRIGTYRNLLATMLLGGLWHGAAWTFVFWGGFHGAGLCAKHAVDGRIGRRTPAWVRGFFTFNAVVFAFILFRADSIGLFWDFLGRFAVLGAPTLWTFPVLALTGLVIGLQLLPPRSTEGLEVRIGRLNPALVGAALAVIVLFVGASVPSTGVPPFIYFRF